MTLLGCVAALTTCYIAPEAVAAPYARALGHGAVATGLLLTAPAIGCVVGALLVGWRTDLDRQLLGPAMGLAGLPLVLCFAHPGLVLTIVLFAVSGIGLVSCTIIAVNLTTVLTADSVRGHVISVFAAVLLTGQGLGAALAGWLATAQSPATSVAILGTVGVVLAAALCVTWYRTPESNEHPIRQGATSP